MQGDISCRAGCGACCIAPSISSPIPGMPDGKPAGVRCIHLTVENLCAIYGQPERPEICGRLRASVEMCGTTTGEALAYLEKLELDTTPRSRRISSDNGRSRNTGLATSRILR